MKIFTPLSIVQSLSLVLLLAACSNQHSIEGLDTDKWKNDRKGCKGDRQSLVDSFIANQDQLKGLRQMEIQEFLGKPDKVKLYRRSQKFFVYFVSPDESCSGNQNHSVTIRLMIKFSAMDISNEVFLEEE